MKFADLAFQFTMEQGKFEEQLAEAYRVDFDSISWDFYDHSLELHNVPRDITLSRAAQDFLHAQGFALVFLNYQGGGESLYNLSNNLLGLEESQP